MLVGLVFRGGRLHPGTETQQGSAVRGARAGKAIPKLDSGGRCRLVVFRLEVGGRWDAEAVSFFRPLARARACATPPALRPAVQAA